MNTIDRLSSYGVFSPEVIERVGDTHSRLQSFGTCQDVFDYAGMPEATTYSADGFEHVSIVDILPQDCDPQSAIIVHLPIANGLDANQLYMLAGLAALSPHSRIIASGNPYINFKAGGGLNSAQRRTAASGDLTPMVEPLMRYVESKRIFHTDHFGYSLGAKKAVAAAMIQASELGVVTAVEPANVVERRLMRLGLQFIKTGFVLDEYINANNLPTYLEARKQSPGLIMLAAGLARPTNVAVARGLTDDKFFTNLHELLIDNLDARALVAWGSESELCQDHIAQEETKRLREVFVGERLQPLRLLGGRHALGSDIPLQNAIALTAMG
jgi:hypothetical protein